ncbi:contractile injection system tape measure protein [Aureibacter tunicatorum]|uniref:Uncharacterized protein n=1 Tax=Aureibacter tunicatorum TaxID=866807 RepID=A0AAE3XR83_9BACT|nr:contractile injection system tape measure protein [Aureibacter tunicatorum]MDR6241667.1 hypothetical protein [Aureibacter tunicatorum]BDD07347.1 hypothetical protein AUTU_48300 [Aureibacter tunicatorum]
MKQHHRILTQKVVLDLDPSIIGSRDQLMREFKMTFDHQMKPIVDKVLTEKFGDANVEIGRLTLDLGNLSITSSQDQLVQVFEKALKELVDELVEQKIPNLEELKEVEEISRQERIEHYLKTGVISRVDEIKLLLDDKQLLMNGFNTQDFNKSQHQRVSAVIEKEDYLAYWKKQSPEQFRRLKSLNILGAIEALSENFQEASSRGDIESKLYYLTHVFLLKSDRDINRSFFNNLFANFLSKEFKINRFEVVRLLNATSLSEEQVIQRVHRKSSRYVKAGYKIIYTDEDLLIHYLKTGFLPSWNDLNGFNMIPELFRSLNLIGGVDLARYFRSEVLREDARKRLLKLLRVQGDINLEDSLEQEARRNSFYTYFKNLSKLKLLFHNTIFDQADLMEVIDLELIDFATNVSLTTLMVKKRYESILERISVKLMVPLIDLIQVLRTSDKDGSIDFSIFFKYSSTPEREKKRTLEQAKKYESVSFDVDEFLEKLSSAGIVKYSKLEKDFGDFLERGKAFDFIKLILDQENAGLLLTNLYESLSYANRLKLYRFLLREKRVLGDFLFESQSHDIARLHEDNIDLFKKVFYMLSQDNIQSEKQMVESIKSYMDELDQDNDVLIKNEDKETNRKGIKEFANEFFQLRNIDAFDNDEQDEISYQEKLSKLLVSKNLYADFLSHLKGVGNEFLMDQIIGFTSEEDIKKALMSNLNDNSSKVINRIDEYLDYVQLWDYKSAENIRRKLYQRAVRRNSNQPDSIIDSLTSILDESGLDSSSYWEVLTSDLSNNVISDEREFVVDPVTFMSFMVMNFLKENNETFYDLDTGIKAVIFKHDFIKFIAYFKTPLERKRLREYLTRRLPINWIEKALERTFSELNEMIDVLNFIDDQSSGSSNRIFIYLRALLSNFLIEFYSNEKKYEEIFERVFRDYVYQEARKINQELIVFEKSETLSEWQGKAKIFYEFQQDFDRVLLWKASETQSFIRVLSSLKKQSRKKLFDKDAFKFSIYTVVEKHELEEAFFQAMGFEQSLVIKIENLNKVRRKHLLKGFDHSIFYRKPSFEKTEDLAHEFEYWQDRLFQQVPELREEPEFVEFEEVERVENPLVSSLAISKFLNDEVLPEGFRAGDLLVMSAMSQDLEEFVKHTINSSLSDYYLTLIEGKSNVEDLRLALKYSGHSLSLFQQLFSEMKDEKELSKASIQLIKEYFKEWFIRSMEEKNLIAEDKLLPRLLTENEIISNYVQEFNFKPFKDSLISGDIHGATQIIKVVSVKNRLDFARRLYKNVTFTEIKIALQNKKFAHAYFQILNIKSEEAVVIQRIENAFDYLNVDFQYFIEFAFERSLLVFQIKEIDEWLDSNISSIDKEKREYFNEIIIKAKTLKDAQWKEEVKRLMTLLESQDRRELLKKHLENYLLRHSYSSSALTSLLDEVDSDILDLLKQIPIVKEQPQWAVAQLMELKNSKLQQRLQKSINLPLKHLSQNLLKVHEYEEVEYSKESLLKFEQEIFSKSLFSSFNTGQRPIYSEIFEEYLPKVVSLKTSAKVYTSLFELQRATSSNDFTLFERILERLPISNNELISRWLWNEVERKFFDLYITKEQQELKLLKRLSGFESQEYQYIKGTGVLTTLSGGYDVRKSLFHFIKGSARATINSEVVQKWIERELSKLRNADEFNQEKLVEEVMSESADASILAKPEKESEKDSKTNDFIELLSKKIASKGQNISQLSSIIRNKELHSYIDKSDYLNARLAVSRYIEDISEAHARELISMVFLCDVSDIDYFESSISLISGLTFFKNSLPVSLLKRLIFSALEGNYFSTLNELEREWLFDFISEGKANAIQDFLIKYKVLGESFDQFQSVDLSKSLAHEIFRGQASSKKIVESNYLKFWKAYSSVIWTGNDIFPQLRKFNQNFQFVSPVVQAKIIDRNIKSLQEPLKAEEFRVALQELSVEVSGSHKKDMDKLLDLFPSGSNSENQGSEADEKVLKKRLAGQLIDRLSNQSILKGEETSFEKFIAEARATDNDVIRKLSDRENFDDKRLKIISEALSEYMIQHDSAEALNKIFNIEIDWKEFYDEFSLFEGLSKKEFYNSLWSYFLETWKQENRKPSGEEFVMSWIASFTFYYTGEIRKSLILLKTAINRQDSLSSSKILRRFPTVLNIQLISWLKLFKKDLLTTAFVESNEFAQVYFHLLKEKDRFNHMINKMNLIKQSYGLIGERLTLQYFLINESLKSFSLDVFDRWTQLLIEHVPEEERRSFQDDYFFAKSYDEQDFKKYLLESHSMRSLKRMGFETGIGYYLDKGFIPGGMSVEGVFFQSILSGDLLKFAQIGWHYSKRDFYLDRLGQDLDSKHKVESLDLLAPIDQGWKVMIAYAQEETPEDFDLVQSVFHFILLGFFENHEIRDSFEAYRQWLTTTFKDKAVERILTSIAQDNSLSNSLKKLRALKTGDDKIEYFLKLNDSSILIPFAEYLIDDLAVNEARRIFYQSSKSQNLIQMAFHSEQQMTLLKTFFHNTDGFYYFDKVMDYMPLSIDENKKGKELLTQTFLLEFHEGFRRRVISLGFLKQDFEKVLIKILENKSGVDNPFMALFLEKRDDFFNYFEIVKRTGNDVANSFLTQADEIIQLSKTKDLIFVKTKLTEFFHQEHLKEVLDKVLIKSPETVFELLDYLDDFQIASILKDIFTDSEELEESFMEATKALKTFSIIDEEALNSGNFLRFVYQYYVPYAGKASFKDFFQKWLNSFFKKIGLTSDFTSIVNLKKEFENSFGVVDSVSEILKLKLSEQQYSEFYLNATLQGLKTLRTIIAYYKINVQDFVTLFIPNLQSVVFTLTEVGGVIPELKKDLIFRFEEIFFEAYFFKQLRRLDASELLNYWIDYQSNYGKGKLKAFVGFIKRKENTEDIAPSIMHLTGEYSEFVLNRNAVVSLFQERKFDFALSKLGRMSNESIVSFRIGIWDMSKIERHVLFDSMVFSRYLSKKEKKTLQTLFDLPLLSLFLAEVFFERDSYYRANLASLIKYESEENKKEDLFSDLFALVFNHLPKSQKKERIVQFVNDTNFYEKEKEQSLLSLWHKISSKNILRTNWLEQSSTVQKKKAFEAIQLFANTETLKKLVSQVFGSIGIEKKENIHEDSEHAFMLESLKAYFFYPYFNQEILEIISEEHGLIINAKGFNHAQDNDQPFEERLVGILKEEDWELLEKEFFLLVNRLDRIDIQALGNLAKKDKDKWNAILNRQPISILKRAIDNFINSAVTLEVSDKFVINKSLLTVESKVLFIELLNELILNVNNLSVSELKDTIGERHLLVNGVTESYSLPQSTFVKLGDSEFIPLSVFVYEKTSGKDDSNYSLEEVLNDDVRHFLRSNKKISEQFSIDLSKNLSLVSFKEYFQTIKPEWYGLISLLVDVLEKFSVNYSVYQKDLFYLALVVNDLDNFLSRFFILLKNKITSSKWKHLVDYFYENISANLKLYPFVQSVSNIENDKSGVEGVQEEPLLLIDSIEALMFYMENGVPPLPFSRDAVDFEKQLEHELKISKDKFKIALVEWFSKQIDIKASLGIGLAFSIAKLFVKPDENLELFTMLYLMFDEINIAETEQVNIKSKLLRLLPKIEKTNNPISNMLQKAITKREALLLKRSEFFKMSENSSVESGAKRVFDLLSEILERDEAIKTDKNDREAMEEVLEVFNSDELEQDNEEDVTHKEEFIELSNAGLIILWPYFKMMAFEMGFLDEEKKKFIDKNSQRRMARLLQYFVDNNVNKREPYLLLNKALAGLEFSEYLDFEIELKDEELDYMHRVQEDMLANWESMKKAEFSVVQDTFISRYGELMEADTFWQLTIPKAEFDHLLDELPWVVSIVDLPWMEKIIQVIWK